MASKAVVGDGFDGSPDPHVTVCSRPEENVEPVADDVGAIALPEVSYAK
jgi:hypothetical protein